MLAYRNSSTIRNSRFYPRDFNYEHRRTLHFTVCLRCIPAVCADSCKLSDGAVLQRIHCFPRVDKQFDPDAAFQTCRSTGVYQRLFTTWKHIWIVSLFRVLQWTWAFSKVIS